MRVFAVICLTAIVAGCGAKTPAEVVKAWAGAHKSVDIEDVMYYSLQDQIKPRIDLAKEAQRTRLEQEWKSESAQDVWGLIKSGNLVREFIRGKRLVPMSLCCMKESGKSLMSNTPSWASLIIE